MTPKNNEVKIPMDLPGTYRVVAASEADNPANTDPMVNPFMAHLITELSIKRPAWEFVSTTRRIVSAGYGPQMYADFTVYDGDDKLGIISREWRHHGDSYTFSNERIQNAKSRGAGTYTKDLKKAVKQITNAFYAPTTTERMSKALGTTKSGILSEVMNKERAFRNAYRKVDDRIEQWALDNWETVAQHIGVTSDPVYETIPALRREAREVGAISNALSHFKGAVVTITGPRYLTSYGWDGEGVVHSYTSEELPPAVKQGVGMLKLVQPNEYIEGVGMRIDSDTYFVMMERPGHE